MHMCLTRGLLVLTLAGTGAAGASSTPIDLPAERAAAAAAWNEGRHDDALAGYDRILERAPDDRVALIRTAKILSWSGRFAAAIERYERALVLDPDDREARLGLARTHAWSGDYAASRAEYDRILAADPNDVEAVVGEARTHAWSGQLAEARAGYERALRVSPGDVDAGVGLAYVDLWSGAVAAAARRADDLARAAPEHHDVQELRRRVRSATAPRVRGWAERTSDTDDNDLDVFGVRGGWQPHPFVGVSAGYARYDMTSPTGDASIDAFDAALVVAPGRRHRVTLSAGVDRRETTTGARESDTLGGVRWDLGLAERWPVWVSASRVPIRYSPAIADNGITLDEIAAGVNGRIGRRWRVAVSAAAADLSDDNDRVTAVAGATRTLRTRGPAVDVGATLRFMDYGRDTNGGYFDPAGFAALLANAAAAGELGARRATWRVELTVGLQSFTRGQGTPAEADVNGDGLVIVSATLGVPVGRGVMLEGYGTWGDYAAQNAGGFESTTVGLRAVWRGGDR